MPTHRDPSDAAQLAGRPLVGSRPAPATRADVAKLAGVSTAVVSYVVNNGPRPVAVGTAARVREAMDLLGYLPNASARALRRGTTETLGLVLADPVNPFFAEYTAELVRAASALGKRLLIAEILEEQAELAVLEDLVARRVDGLLLATGMLSPGRSRLLAGAGIPTVFISSANRVPGARTVGSDAVGAAEGLVKHLVRHGRRRIGLVIGTGGFGDPDPRKVGWRNSLRLAGLSEGASVMMPFTRQGGYLGASALLEENPELDAVFASNDLQAIGLVRALHERGIRIPEDVAVVSFDGTQESEFCWPPLTVARQPLSELAAAALALLDTPERAEGTHVQLQTEFIRRASCGCTQSMGADGPT